MIDLAIRKSCLPQPLFAAHVTCEDSVPKCTSPLQCLSCFNTSQNPYRHLYSGAKSSQAAAHQAPYKVRSTKEVPVRDTSLLGRPNNNAPSWRPRGSIAISPTMRVSQGLGGITFRLVDHEVGECHFVTARSLGVFLHRACPARFRTCDSAQTNQTSNTSDHKSCVRTLWTASMLSSVPLCSECTWRRP